ncbi:MAG TPA: hypothetical protein VK983_04935 [Candidatus Limnocylindrales bacterium]|nr:hypothetical protein [Candidatus Limnocylindrales bacterium]
MTSSIKTVMAAAALIVVSSSASVYAVTSLDFSTKANIWANDNCTQRELDKVKVELKDVACYNYHQNAKQNAEILALRNTKSTASYPLKTWDVNAHMSTMSPSELHSNVMVPTDGTLTTITALKPYNYINSTITGGKTTFTAVVNGADTNLSTYIDATHEKNITTNGSVPVKAGDAVTIRQTSENMQIESPNSLFLYIPYTVGLQVEQ